MSTFDEREKVLKKFAHDEELQFKVSARRNKYIGQWVSQILGYNPDQEKGLHTSSYKGRLCWGRWWRCF